MSLSLWLISDTPTSGLAVSTNELIDEFNHRWGRQNVPGWRFSRASSENLKNCLMRQWLCRQRFCTKRQRNGLMIYNKIDWYLVITKQIFNYYNINFSLEITSKVQKVNQKYTFTHKLTTKCNFQMPSLFFSSTVTEWNAQDCGISNAAKDTSMLCCLQKSIRWRHLMRQEVKLTLDSDMAWCLWMCPPKAAFFSFRMQHSPSHKNVHQSFIKISLI